MVKPWLRHISQWHCIARFNAVTHLIVEYAPLVILVFQIFPDASNLSTKARYVDGKNIFININLKNANHVKTEAYRDVGFVIVGKL